jgi:hypothetical protein
LNIWFNSSIGVTFPQYLGRISVHFKNFGKMRMSIKMHLYMLCRFSQFFISPLAKAEAMDREVQAIDSEFEQVLQSDACRLLQLQCHTAKPSHPFNKFSWGNVFSFDLQLLECGK